VKRSPVTLSDLEGVFAVPPLARSESGPYHPKSGPGCVGLVADQNEAIVRHIRAGGITRLLYGGNAFLYHIPSSDYEGLVDWMAAVDGDVWMIPSLGPSYGRALDQARVLRRHPFPAAMLLPCSDPRDAAGLERGARDIAEALGAPLVLYLKAETTFGEPLDEGLDAIGRLVADGVCAAIKYAVVRRDPSIDPYLDALLARVDRRRVVSGIGERPAVAHMQHWRLPGFTTGSGCLAPRLSARLFDACRSGDFAAAEHLRQSFLPLEDIRDEAGPARVLHAAVEAAGLARVGPVRPFVSDLEPASRDRLEPVARALLAENARATEDAHAPQES
jgi:dihydrodipicolinate synthase/N-acetylneuraminate lyase